MLMKCRKCKSLTIDYVNKASGLDLHRFNWLDNEEEIGEIKGEGWNQLLTNDHEQNSELKIAKSKLVHWTIGGPWFKEQRNIGGEFAREWFRARDEAMRLWE